MRFCNPFLPRVSGDASGSASVPGASDGDREAESETVPPVGLPDAPSGEDPAERAEDGPRRSENPRDLPPESAHEEELREAVAERDDEAADDRLEQVIDEDDDRAAARADEAGRTEETADAFDGSDEAFEEPDEAFQESDEAFEATDDEDEDGTIDEDRSP